MDRFSRRHFDLLTCSIAAACLLFVCHAGSATARADDDDDDEKSAPKTAVQKERAADEALFEKLDENEDGWLSGTEMSSVKGYDVDANGRVTKIEFLAGQAKSRLAKVKPSIAPPTTTPDVVPAPAAPPPTTPAAVPSAALLPVVGSLSMSQAVLMHRHLSLLTTALEKGLLTGKETEQKVLDVAQQMPVISELLSNAKPGLSPTDRNFITAIQDVHQLLRAQAQLLVVYSRVKDEKQLAAVREAESRVEAGFRKMLGPTPTPAATPASDAEQAVNAEVIEGNKLAEQAGAKFNAIFADEHLNGFPENRAEFKKNAQRVAELLAAVAVKYRAAAVLCEKASQKSASPGDARYWAIKGRSYRRIAESKESLRSVALLIEDEAVKDRAIFQSRAKPLIEEAVEVAGESQKLSKQAAELWKQIHPEK